MDVLNPATQQVIAQVPLSTGEELKAAVFAAKRSLTSWRNTPVTTRQRFMFKLQELIRRDIDKLASSITAEQGKTLKDAFNDVTRGIELVEHTCGLANLHMGDFFSNVSNGIDTYSIREPLGVCAGICSFNFPAMIPLLIAGDKQELYICEYLVTWSKFASGQIATNIKFYHSMKFLTGGISSLEIFFLFPLSITLSEKFFLSDHYRRLNAYF
ncbi:hypothetical protein ACS0TY_032045 [Phlomoides rotata]